MSQSPVDLEKPKHARADQRLRTDLMMWLSTVRPDGRPHLVPVWFLWDGTSILILSKDDQKMRNLRANPRVMLAVDDTKGGGDVVMLEGEAALVDRESVTSMLPTYADKYAENLAQFQWTIESMGREYDQTILITPSKLY